MGLEEKKEKRAAKMSNPFVTGLSIIKKRREDANEREEGRKKIIKKKQAANAFWAIPRRG